MKFSQAIIFAVVCLTLVFYSNSSESSSNAQAIINELIGDYKILFMYRYHSVSDDVKNSLNKLNFKNLVLGQEEIAVFNSANEDNPVN